MAGQEKFDNHFEREWKAAMKDMQENPPGRVWNEIDRQLAYEELAVYKNKVVYYKWSAAAVVLLAAFGSIFFVLFGSGDTGTGYADVGRIDGPAFTQNKFQLPVFVEVRDESETQRGASFLVATSGEQEGEQGEEKIPSGNFDMNQFNEISLDKMHPELLVASNYEEKEIFKIPTYNFKLGKRKRENDERYWAGVNVGRGSFDPNFESQGNTLATDATVPMGFSAANDEAVDMNAPDVREDMSAGGTTALGLNFGVKVGDRWTLESGLQYMRSGATTTTNVVIETTTIREVIPASSEFKNVPQVQRAIREEAVIEYDYVDIKMANEFQFATVPVKAGYLLIDSKFKFELNAGVAANVYLGNKLTASDDQLVDVTIGPGSSSPYRELSFSGLAGLQFGYEFFDKFDLIVEPNYRRAINSLTKDNSAFTTNPSGFGVMTGIRYRFD